MSNLWAKPMADTVKKYDIKGIKSRGLEPGDPGFAALHGKTYMEKGYMAHFPNGMVASTTVNGIHLENLSNTHALEILKKDFEVGKIFTNFIKLLNMPSCTM